MLLYYPHYLFKRDVITVIASFEPPQSKKLSSSVFVFHAYTFHLKEHRLASLTFAH